MAREIMGLRQIWAGSALFAAVLAISPAHAQTRLQLDRCAARDGDLSLELAIGGCTAAIRSGQLSQKDLAWAHHKRGLYWYSKGNFNQAIADYDQAIGLDPKYIAAYSDRGFFYRGKGDYGRAIADYDQVIRLDPKSAAAYNNRALSWYYKGNFDRAIDDLDQAVRLDPKYAIAYNNRGLAYYEKGAYDSAIADFDRAIRLDPKYADAVRDRGVAWYRKGNYDQAISDFNKAIGLDPKFAYAFYNRGDAYRDKGDYDLAIADYGEAIRLVPNYGPAFLSRGIANVYAGSLHQALADLDRAGELLPKDTNAALWRDIVAKRGHLPSRLPELVSRLDMTKWPAPVVRLFLGEMTPASLLAAADDPDVTTRKGQVCEANFYSGEFALQQGAKEEAARLFGLAAALCPRSFIAFVATNAELKALGDSR
jgi:lipoprotein NlpI